MVDKPRLGLWVGRQWGPGKGAGRGLYTERPGRGVLPTPRSWCQWPLLGVYQLSMECSGGNGWGQLKEAPLRARALSSCGEGSAHFPALELGPAAWLTAPGEDFIHQRNLRSSGPIVLFNSISSC